jgi:hypothetical protein
MGARPWLTSFQIVRVDAHYRFLAGYSNPIGGCGAPDPNDGPARLFDRMVPLHDQIEMGQPGCHVFVIGKRGHRRMECIFPFADAVPAAFDRRKLDVEVDSAPIAGAIGALRSAECITIWLDRGAFLNRLIAGLILMPPQVPSWPPRSIAASAKGDAIEYDRDFRVFCPTVRF